CSSRFDEQSRTQRPRRGLGTLNQLHLQIRTESAVAPIPNTRPDKCPEGSASHKATSSTRYCNHDGRSLVPQLRRRSQQRPPRVSVYVWPGGKTLSTTGRP